MLAKTLLPCSSSMATISASAPFPTVTLDLTQSPTNIPFANIPQQSFGQAALVLPQIFGQALYNQSKFSGLQMSQDIEAAAAAQLGHHPQMQQTQSGTLADTVNALTADPNFTAALAAAVSSIIGSGSQANISSPNINNVNTSHVTATNSNNNNGSVTTSMNNTDGNI